MPSSISNSDGLRPAHPLSFFDPEHVERPIPDRRWRALFAAALAATVALTLGWELYWRANWHEPGDISNSAGLWAQERRKAKGDATVLIGSSRIFFDVDLDVWENKSGVRPIQLALEGTSPRLFLTHLADDPEFSGLVVVGVTAPLFFPESGGRRAEVLDYYRDETPSQKVDHRLSVLLEKAFAFMDEQTRPKRMIFLAALPPRAGMKERFDPHKLMRSDDDRNTEMWRRVEEDPEYRALAKEIWTKMFKREAPKPGEAPKGMPPAAVDAVMKEVKANVDKIRARGGDVVFVRFPYEGMFEIEDVIFPRDRYWDRLLKETDAVGIAWQDHPELQGYELAEWSHLTASEAERFTAALAPILYREIERRKAGR